MAVLKLERVILRYPHPVNLGHSPLASWIPIMVNQSQSAGFPYSFFEVDKRFTHMPAHISAKWRGRLGIVSEVKEDYYECMIFVFSDGMAIGLKDLPSAPAPYLNALPDGLRWPDLVMALRHNQSENADVVWMSNHPKAYLSENSAPEISQLFWSEQSTLSFDSLMTLTVRFLMKKTVHRDVKVGLSFSSTSEPSYFEVSAIEISDAPIYQVRFEPPTEDGSLGLADFESCRGNDQVQTPYFTYNTNTKVLTFTQNARAKWTSLVKVWGEMLEGHNFERQKNLNLDLLPFHLSRFRLNIDQSSLLKKLQQLSSQTLKLDLSDQTQAQFIRPLLNLTQQLSLISVGIPLNQGYLINWGEVTCRMIETGSEGLKGFLVDEGKNLVTQRQGQRRNDELKLLRHQGCAFVALFETSLYVQGLSQTDETIVENDEDFFQYLFERWQMLVQLKKDRPANEEPMIGTYLLEALKKVIKSILAELRTAIPLLNFNDGKAAFELHASPEPLLLSGLFQIFMRTLGPEVFSKMSTKLDTALVAVKTFRTVKPSAEFQNAYCLELVVSPEVRGWHMIPIFKEVGFDVLVDGVSLSELSEDDFKSVISVESGESGKESYFALNPGVFFRGVKVNPAELTFEANGEFIRYKDEVYFVNKKNLPGLKSLMAFWQRLAQEKSAEQLVAEAVTVKVQSHKMLDVLALASQGVELELDEDSQRVVDHFSRLGEAQASQKDLHSQIEFKPYQLTGVQWLMDLFHLGLGGILSDEMGLGKTAQVLGFLELLRKRKTPSARPALIVVPTSLVHNWKFEADRFFPKLKVTILNSGVQIQKTLKRKLTGKDVLVTTYGLMQVHKEILQGVSWQVLIFDEAHQLKNLTAQRTAVAKQLEAQFKLAVTGTPVENNLIEFYSLFDLVLPGALGPLVEFRKLYVDDFSFFKSAHIQHLKLRSKPILLRRTKKSVQLELPDKIETLVPLQMEKTQKDLYKKVALQFNDEIMSVVDKSGEASAQLHMLAGLMRLRQICSHPGVIESSNYQDVPPKLEYLLTMLPEIIESNESVLIFTQFKKTMDLMIPHLKKIAPVYSIHGGISSDERQKNLKAFSDNVDPAILIMTLKTGGVGLNLTKASYVFHLEPWWNPAAEDQATDRAHRMGQKKTVNVYRLIMQDSLEERIQEMKERKKKLYAALLGDPAESLDAATAAAGGQRLSKDDFVYLISGGGGAKKEISERED